MDKKPYKVLVIEDNAGDFLIVEDFLTQQIFDPVVIEHAVNFRQATALLQAEDREYDVILLDLTLPDKTGQDLVTDIILVSSSCPIIILTGYTDISFSIKSISLGISDYLIKDDLTASTLYKSILYSIERKKIILQLEESEKRYSNLFHMNPEPMWVFTLGSLEFLDVNNAAIKHYGYTRREFLSMTIQDIVLKDAPARKTDADITGGNILVPETRYTHQRKNGTTVQVEYLSNKITFKGQKAEIGISHDITERNKQLNTIEEQNEKLKEIAWIQSHVVRAPLSRMMGLISLVKDTGDSWSDRTEILDNILSSAKELDTVIRTISDKIEKSKVSI